MKYEGRNGSFTTAFQWNYFTNHLHVSTMQTLEPLITMAFMNESGKNLLHGFASENYVSQKHFTSQGYTKRAKKILTAVENLRKYFQANAWRTSYLVTM